MKRFAPAFVLSGVLASVTLQATPAARADDAHAAPPDQAAEADTHFRQGVALYKEQSFAAALVEFRKAYAVLPDWHVLYNIGVTQLELKDDAGAFTALDRYQREASGISDKRKAEVTAQVDRLRERVGTLRVSVNQAGADITVDDVAVGKSPLTQPLVVNIGSRRVVATLSSGQKASRLVDVASRDDVSVDLVFAQDSPSAAALLPAPPAGPLAAAPPPRYEAPPPVRRPDVLWVGFVVTGTLAAAGAVTGVLALKAKSDADGDASQLGVTASTLADANSRKHTFANVTDALLASAVAAGGVTLYFALRHPKARTSPPGLVGWSLWVSPQRAALSLEF